MSKLKPYRNSQLAAYSLLAFPLSLVALPIYINVPKFYSDLGLSLSAIALPLFLVRCLDAVQDPVIGLISEKFRIGRNRLKLILLSSPLLVLSLLLLFNPPSSNLSLWMMMSLMLVSFAHSIISINYETLGAELGRSYKERINITTVRETFGLVGVLIASILPNYLVEHHGLKPGYAMFSYVCIAIVLVPVLIAFRYSPVAEVSTAPAIRRSLRENFLITIRNRQFLWLAVIFVFNAIAASIPAAAVLFYIEDVLNIQNQLTAGTFLLCYFLSGALGMPLWYRLANQLGKKNAWLVSMVISIVAFIWAFLIGAENYYYFYAVCIFSGLALGADLALPPAILADIIADKKDGNSSSYFGIWNFLAKANFAIATALTLFLLDISGYQPKVRDEASLVYLAGVYALLPCALKVFALVTLKISPLDKRKL